MDKQEMLGKLGLSEDEYKKLLTKFATFFNSLEDNQKRVINNWLPHLDEIAKSFGPDVTVEQLKKLSDLENVCIGVAAIAFKPGPQGPKR